VIAVIALLAMAAQAPRVLDQSARVSIQSPRQVVVRSQAAWEALAPDLRGGPAPVDFSKEMIVGVFLGSKPTPGYAVTIVGAEEREGVLHVTYRETAPAPGRISAQVITFPYQLVAIPQSSAKDVKFEKIE